MDKENDKEVEETEEEVEELDESEEKTTDWEARAKQLEGIAKRRATKIAKLKEENELAKKAATAPIEKEKKGEKTKFDYAEKAFLNSEGVPKEDFDYLLGEAVSTGKELDYLLGLKYVQEELKSRKQSRETEAAIPDSTKRSGGGAKDSVDYWIAKGELPPADQLELRRKVVNEKIKRANQA